MIYNTPKEFLSEIRRIMALQDIPMKELAARMETTQQNASKIFTQCNPKLETLYNICNALNLQMDIKFISKDDTN